MKKDLVYYLSLPYPIELIPDEDGTWFAHIPLLKGCMTQGDNRRKHLSLRQADSLFFFLTI